LFKRVSFFDCAMWIDAALVAPPFPEGKPAAMPFDITVSLFLIVQ